MSINREIENYRKIHNIPVFIMCNILNIETEMMYHKIKSGKNEPIKQGENSVYFLEKAHDCINSVVCFRSGSTLTVNLGKPLILSGMSYL